MRFEIGDIVRMVWHDTTNQPGVVVGLIASEVKMDTVQIWWPSCGYNIGPTPFIIRLQHDDEDLLLYDKAL